MASHLKQEGDAVKVVFFALLLVERRMDLREVETSLGGPHRMAAAVIQIMMRASHGSVAVDTEGQNDLGDHREAESMAMGDMGKKKGK